MTEEKLLTSSERATFSLRSLYRQYGYLPFKMSKFEEYDLYVSNKDFLISDNVITFNDTDGRLLALKPDVTLSIIKNSSCETGCKQKVYYNENVYRVSQKLHRFKEIMQVGLECIGDTDILDTYEVIELAAKSLALVAEDFVLDISHLGILSKVLAYASDSRDFAKEATVFIAEKNRHELMKLCERCGVIRERADLISELLGMYGDMESVLLRLAPICALVGADEQYGDLVTLCTMLMASQYASRIKIDFSVVNNMNYYNGIVFKGFIEGIPDGPLAGGEYGTLMNKMGKSAGAVGFAIYLDMLDELSAPSREYDVDVLVVYDKGCDPRSVQELKNKLIAEGRSVSVQKNVPSKLRYKEIIKLEM